MLKNDHICVCICTYKRPELLKLLLSKLEEQVTESHFDYSIVIVDNHRLESARSTVESYARQSKISIRYFVEPEQNIALARNKAVENAKGDYIAFIDDDEFPSNTWLIRLYAAFNKYKPSGGVLGPVIPYYPVGTPKWLVKSKICERPNHPTGTKLDWNMTRTGNVLLTGKIFIGKKNYFNEKKGRTGGEDKLLFQQLMKLGFSFIWCQEADVYETIYPDRWKLSHYLNRRLCIGGEAGRENGVYSVALTRSLVAILVYTALLSVSILMGKRYTYKYLLNIVYHFARVMGCFGIVLERGRRD
jgi:succinoglycan biosynthesis protein ExoM